MPSEPIFNLWYIVDEEHQYIFSIAGRAYIADGTDDEKTALLKQLAATDFPMALQLPVPDRYETFYAGKMRPGIVPVAELDNPATQLFEELYQAIEAELAERAKKMRLPADTYKVPDNPLYVMTALYLEDEGGARVLGAAE
jgi:hypothetical protein